MATPNETTVVDERVPFTKLVRGNNSFLIEHMRLDPLQNDETNRSSLLTILEDRRILVSRQVNSIRCEQSNYHKIVFLINIMRTRPIRDTPVFLQALRDTNQKHIADRLLQNVD